MREVYPGIYMITEKSFSNQLTPPVNVYVIPGEDGLIFEAGYGQRRFLKKFVRELEVLKNKYEERRESFNISRVLISHSHPDHCSKLKKLKKTLGLEVVLTRTMQYRMASEKQYREWLDLRRFYQRGPIYNAYTYLLIKCFISSYRILFGLQFCKFADRIVEENSTIRINNRTWEIFHSPGHSDDHICLYDRENGVLFAGDNILRTRNIWFGPPGSNLRDYISTLEAMLELSNLEIVLPTHGSPIEEPQRRIKEMLELHRGRITTALSIVNDCGDKGITERQLIKRLFPGKNWLTTFYATGWVQLVLRYLEDDGRIMKKENYAIARYYGR